MCGGGCDPNEEMMKKRADYGTTGTGFWIEWEMDIDCAFWKI